MSGRTWKASVERARLASLKSFEGRMESAAASHEQIPLGSRGPRTDGRTLADFAEEAGIQRTKLAERRRVWKWLGRPESTVISTLSVSYSTALEACDHADKTSEWGKKEGDGQEFLAFVDGEVDPPTWEVEGYEPYTFKSWTVDALRVYLGLEPTNTAKANLKARTEGRDLTEDEATAAEVKDDLEHATKKAGEVQNLSASRDIKRAAQDAEEKITKHHDEVVHEMLTDDMAADEDVMTQAALMDAIRSRDAFLRAVRFRAERLTDALDKGTEWFDRFGGELAGDDGTLADIARDSLNEEKATVIAAFERAVHGGIETVEEYLNRY